MTIMALEGGAPQHLSEARSSSKTRAALWRNSERHAGALPINFIHDRAAGTVMYSPGDIKKSNPITVKAPTRG